MSDWTEEKKLYLSHFFANEKKLNGEHPWLKEFRNAAIAHFSELGFPSTRNEEWRFTDIAPVMEIPFRPAVPVNQPLSFAELPKISFPDSNFTQLVFINGFFSESLSSVRGVPEGVHIGGLAAAFEPYRSILEPILNSRRDFGNNAFLMLNNAFLSDGAFVYIPSGTSLPNPIHLLFLSASASDSAISFPRSIIFAGRGSQASVIESYAGLDSGLNFTDSATEVHMGPSSIIDHYRIQRESMNAFHIAALQVFQEQDSSYVSHSLSLGGSLVRNNFDVFLSGSGADCTLNGLYALGGRQHLDNHTSIDHGKPYCTSRELYKGILDDSASAVFNGRIVVRKDAQKTNARQTNKNLLLSRQSTINTMPHLEIFANDVKCTHGATIGQLNAEELFYLRSRGIDLRTARMILTYGFASELLSLLKIKPLQRQMDEALLNRLSFGVER
jgi:Fe-S cluster assembly protein SufD